MIKNRAHWIIARKRYDKRTENRAVKGIEFVKQPRQTNKKKTSKKSQVLWCKAITLEDNFFCKLPAKINDVICWSPTRF